MKLNRYYLILLSQCSSFHQKVPVKDQDDTLLNKTEKTWILSKGFPLIADRLTQIPGMALVLK